MNEIEKVLSDLKAQDIMLTMSSEIPGETVLLIHNLANDKYHLRRLSHREVTSLTDEGILRLIESMKKEVQEKEKQPPYSEKDYQDAKSQGLDLDNWNDYERYYQLGEQEEY